MASWNDTERENMRSRLMGAAQSGLENLRDVINDDVFTVADVCEELAAIAALVYVARTITGDDPYGIGG